VQNTLLTTLSARRVRGAKVLDPYLAKVMTRRDGLAPAGKGSKGRPRRRRPAKVR